MTESTLFPQHPGAGEPTLTRRQLRERERAANLTPGGRHTPVETPVVVQQVEAPAAPQPEPAWESIFNLTPEEPTQPTSRRAAVRAQSAAKAERPSRVSRAANTEAPVATTPVAIAERQAPSSRVAASARPTKVARSGKTARSGKAARPAKAARRTKVKSKRVWVSSRSFAPSGPPRRKVKAAATKALSFVAMLFVGALFVGVTVPSNAFMTSDASGTSNAATVADAGLAEDSRPTQTLAVSDQVAAGVTRHDDLKVISFAEVLAIKYANISYEYQATDGAIRWPFPVSVPITDGFGNRDGGFHKGTDFAAGAGTPIYAIADGVVTYVQADYTGYGYNAIISHVVNGQQVKSQYAHMISDSSPLVVGEEIRVGDFVGLVGNTGISYGAHLHLEIHLDDVPVDPFVWLTANAV